MKVKDLDREELERLYARLGTELLHADALTAHWLKLREQLRALRALFNSMDRYRLAQHSYEMQGWTKEEYMQLSWYWLFVAASAFDEDGGVP